MFELNISCYLVKELSGHGLWGPVVIRVVHRVADALNEHLQHLQSPELCQHTVATLHFFVKFPFKNRF